MEFKLLITIGDDPSCLYGARFVAGFFDHKDTIAITLYYSASETDPLTRSANGGRDNARRDAEIRMEKGRAALDFAKGFLIDHGFKPDAVETKFSFRQFGLVKDITREAALGAHDAIVLGRRGYLIFEGVFAESVSRSVLDSKIGLPVWVCRMPAPGRRNVLLCVDGSQSALRAAEQVGLFLRDEKQHTVTVLHIDTGQEHGIDLMVDDAVQGLHAFGVEDDRVHTRVVRSPKVAPVILELAQSEQFAAVAVGRVGLIKSGLEGWLVGSRTMKLLESLEGSALWVSR